MKIEANKMNEVLINQALCALGAVMIMQLTTVEKLKFHEVYQTLVDLRNSVNEPEGATLKIIR